MMRLLTTFILMVLLFLQIPMGEDVQQLTARAIRENRPKLCEKAKEHCSSSDFETMCIPASLNRFACYRDYAFAKNDSSICEKIRGESGSGHSYRDGALTVTRKRRGTLAPAKSLIAKAEPTEFSMVRALNLSNGGEVITHLMIV